MSAWAALRAAYEAARAAENQYEAEQYKFAGITAESEKLPIGPERNAIYDRLPAEYWVEIERLEELRHAAEEPLMDCPSPDAAALAFKFLVAHGQGRQADFWDNMLEEEAKRFAFERKAPASSAEWDAAEAELRRIEAKFAEAVADDVTDAVANEYADAMRAIIALTPTTVAQAFRRYELATFDGDLAGVDCDAVYADLKRIAEAGHA